MEDYKKKYEDALERANAKIETYNRLGNASMVKSICDIFPELKESEDERVRKSIIDLVEKQMPKSENKKWMIAWLEKQGKKIDVIENFDTEFEKQVSHLIASTINKEYEYTSDFVKWTANTLLNYAKHELEKQGEREHIVVVPRFRVGDVIRPKGSTAEYTIESISGECYHGKGWGLHISCDDDYELVEQKTAWSEEDEKMWATVSDLLWEGYKLSDKKVSWYNIRYWLLPKIICLKDRVQPQPKQEWSEEDERMLTLCASSAKTRYTDGLLTYEEYKQASLWLKSLKERYTWKPSDEQIEAIRIAAEIGTANNSWAMGILKSMYQDLKKLKEE